MKTIKIILKIILGIIVIIAIPVLLFLLSEVLLIRDFITLKWFPLVSCLIGFFLAGLINRKTNPIFIPILYLGLAIYVTLRYFFFPFILLLILFSALGILITRDEIMKAYKIISAVLAITVFSYFLFSQPLIIEKEGYGTNSNKDLYNAKVLWGLSNQKPATLPKEIFKDKNGQSVSLQDFKGKDLYITFWATWCGPCIAEKPMLEELKESLKDDSTLVFIDISVDKDTKAWLDYLDKNNPTAIQLITNNENRTRSNFRFDGIPFNILANSDIPNDFSLL